MALTIGWSLSGANSRSRTPSSTVAGKVFASAVAKPVFRGSRGLHGAGAVALAARVGEVLRCALGVVQDVDVLLLGEEERIEGKEARVVREEIEDVLAGGLGPVGKQERRLLPHGVKAHVLDRPALERRSVLDPERVEGDESPRREEGGVVDELREGPREAAREALVVLGGKGDHVASARPWRQQHSRRWCVFPTRRCPWIEGSGACVRVSTGMAIRWSSGDALTDPLDPPVAKRPGLLASLVVIFTSWP